MQYKNMHVYMSKNINEKYITTIKIYKTLIYY